jgi:hypothetical protein
MDVGMKTIIESTISKEIDSGFLEYSMYVLEQRAIPSVIDGFKNVHRKLVYAMLNDHGGGKVKVADLAGISKCIAPETIIYVNNKKMTVSELYDNFSPGDIIQSYNEETKIFENCDILGVYEKKDTNEFISILMTDESTIDVTPEHQLLLSTGKWVMAKDLKEGDDIMQI